eukprot:TRINITY_DN7809_c0_g2_i2.p2 TRINITY_DN7809_c0_g2~~TRINITY_DN7809_c0_g2_i2.p2  ORF type:complete len:199 (-),score=46.76 TRINITY_DN7809_c0_g2_i2:134-646(-)
MRVRGHCGEHAARNDRGHLNTERREFVAQGQRHAVDRVLGHVVGACTDRIRQDRARAVVGDARARGIATNQRQERLNHAQLPEHVDVEQALHVRELRPFEHTDADIRDTSHVHEQIEPFSGQGFGDDLRARCNGLAVRNILVDDDDVATGDEIGRRTRQYAGKHAPSTRR